MVNGGRKENAFFPKIRNWVEMFTLLLLFTREVLVNRISQEKKRYKDCKGRTTKLFLSVDDMIIYVENPRESIRKPNRIRKLIYQSLKI